MQPVDSFVNTLVLSPGSAEPCAELPFDLPDSESFAGHAASLTCWSRLDGRSRLIVRRDGSLVASSEDVPELIRQHECFSLENGKLRIIHERVRKAFTQIVEDSNDGAGTLLLPRAGGDGHWIVRFVCGADDLLFITLQAATPDYTAGLPDLCEAFGFTPSEAQIVRDLYDGLAPQSIAQEHKISIHTVRAHIRRCYDKLQITSREELWHKLSAYQI